MLREVGAGVVAVGDNMALQTSSQVAWPETRQQFGRPKCILIQNIHKYLFDTTTIISEQAVSEGF